MRVVVDLYGQHLELYGQVRTLEILIQTCTSAVKEIGDKTFALLKPVHVTDSLALMSKLRTTKKYKAAKWGPMYQNRVAASDGQGHIVARRAADLDRAGGPGTGGRTVNGTNTGVAVRGAAAASCCGVRVASGGRTSRQTDGRGRSRGRCVRWPVGQ